MNITTSTSSSLTETLSNNSLPVLMPVEPTPEFENFAKAAVSELILQELERAARDCFVHPNLERKFLEELSHLRSLSYEELLRALVMAKIGWGGFRAPALRGREA